MVNKVKFHPVVITAVSLWVITGIMASIEWHGISLRRIVALVAISSAVTLLGAGLQNKRLTVAGSSCVTKFVGRAIVRAPRQAWYNGYGTGADDTLKSLEATMPNIRRLDESTHDLAGR